MYNLTNVSDANTSYGLITAANNATNGILFGMFIIVMFTCTLLIMRKHPFEKVLIVDSFIFFFLSLILRYAGLLPNSYWIAFLVMTALSGFYIMIQNND